jgi:Protein of unknown function (DUF3302)
MKLQMPASSSGSKRATATLAMAACVIPSAARASFLPPEMMDAAAGYIAWFVICVVPIAVIVLFWLVHVMPEKIAEKRHHPQKEAIHTLCLLSLVFGGLLWPLAWLWAYVKPVGHQLAYGTEKHDDYFHEMGDKAQAGELLDHELAHLRDTLDAMAARSALSPRLKALRKDLDAPRSVVPESGANSASA